MIKTIPLRISVTGIRGKSSVVRMLASILREDGRTVLAKTTGSEAKFILPHGEEIDIQRRGLPSIIEQKKLIKKAVELNADCLVAEIMSIHPENHFIEAQQLLKPNIVVITNVRLDHIDAMGKTYNEIASVLSLDISEKAIVFIPEKENRPIFQNAVKNTKGDLVLVREGISSLILPPDSDSKQTEFSDNLDLVCSVGKYLKIDHRTILNGICKARYDIGQFKIWIYRSEETQKINYFINGFSANDPESTLQIIFKVRKIFPSTSNKLFGLLSLRSDRGDRTIQWIEAIKNGASNHFNKIYVLGTHAKLVKRKVKWVEVLKSDSPEIIMKMVLNQIDDQAVVFGFGNIGGTGKLLVDYWAEIGDVYGV